MGLYKRDVTPVLMHWSYIFFVLTHGNNGYTVNYCISHSKDTTVYQQTNTAPAPTAVLLTKQENS